MIGDVTYLASDESYLDRAWGRARRTLARNRWARGLYRRLRRPMHARAAPPAPLTRHGVARQLAEPLRPEILISATSILVALTSAASPEAGIGWAALAVFFGVLAPAARNWRGARWAERDGGTAERDGETGVRGHRSRRPVSYGLAPLVAGLLLLVVLGAPRPLVALLVAMLGVRHVVAAVRRRWPRRRPDAHAAVAAGCVTALVAVFGAALIAGYLVAAATGWARVVRGERTTTEAVTGALTGIAVTTPVFLLIS